LLGPKPVDSAPFPPELREALARRDPAALARFFDAHFDRVYGYVRRFVADEHAAEDLTQDVFLQVQRALATYDPARDPRPWLFAIATNKLRDHWRARRGAGAEASLDEEELGLPHAASPEASGGRLDGEELALRVRAAIDALPGGAARDDGAARARGALVRGDRARAGAQRGRGAQALLARPRRAARVPRRGVARARRGRAMSAGGGPEELDPAELDPADLDPAELDPAELDPAERARLEELLRSSGSPRPDPLRREEARRAFLAPAGTTSRFADLARTGGAMLADDDPFTTWLAATRSRRRPAPTSVAARVSPS
jgi:RNA polymerase sigma factor (sigma-70 family)